MVPGVVATVRPWPFRRWQIRFATGCWVWRLYLSSLQLTVRPPKSKGFLEEIHLPTIKFQGRTVSFREDTFPRWIRQNKMLRVFPCAQRQEWRREFGGIRRWKLFDFCWRIIGKSEQTCHFLGGGFKHALFIFYPYLGKIPMLTNIFQRGWNHQVVLFTTFFLLVCFVWQL